jgi:hypothetical protein
MEVEVAAAGWWQDLLQCYAMLSGGNNQDSNFEELLSKDSTFESGRM